MSKRKRLTDKGLSKKALTYENTDPGSLNVQRYNPDMEKYLTWDPEAVVNFEQPDMRHDWKEDQTIRHPSLHVPMPSSRQAKLAALKTAQVLAKKSAMSIRIAKKLFPDGTDLFIEKQATDLMDLPLKSLEDTISRIAKYEEEGRILKAMNEDEDEDEGTDEDGWEDEDADEEVEEDESDGEVEEEDEVDVEDAAPVGEVPATDAAPVDIAPAPAGGTTAEPPPGVKEQNTSEQEAAYAESTKGGEGSPYNDTLGLSEDAGMGDFGDDEEVVGQDELPIEFDGQDMDVQSGPADSMSDEDLEGLFTDESKEGVPSAEGEEENVDEDVKPKMSSLRTASKNNRNVEKKGVKKIASGPRSNSTTKDLSGLWESAPDVRHIFG